MRSWLTDTLQQYPEIAVMLTLLTGFLVGRVHIKGFTLGTVTGVLLVGIVIGSFHINIPSETKSIFFLFFLFCTGYGIGPQFFQGLKKDGLLLALFSFIVCCSSLLFCWGLASLLRFETGTTAGLMSGANTCSAIIGVASNTINELDLTDQDDESAPLLAVQDAINSKVPALGYTVAYAVANITLTTSGVIIVLLMHKGG